MQPSSTNSGEADCAGTGIRKQQALNSHLLRVHKVGQMGLLQLQASLKMTCTYVSSPCPPAQERLNV